MFIRLSESDAVDVPSRVDWHTSPGQGWYIKEHYHAEDFAFMVCDEQSVGATAVFDMGVELPAGEWRVFVRHIRNRVGGTNVLGMALGNMDSTGRFVASGELSMSWDSNDHPRDYRWAETVIKTTARSRFLQVTARAVERSGIGDMPEYPMKVLLLDTLAVSDRKDIVVEVSKGGRRPNKLIVPGLSSDVSRDTAPEAERSHVWLAPDPEGPSRVELVKKDGVTERRETNVTGGNMVRGGGFDAAINPYWFILAPGGYYPTSDRLDGKSPFQGCASIRLRGYDSCYTPGADFKSTLISAPIPLPPGSYKCVFHARTDDPQAKLDVLVAGYVPRARRLEKGPVVGRIESVQMGKEWKKVELTLEVKELMHVQAHFNLSSFSGAPDADGLSKGSVWIDAFSISPDKTDFEPQLPVQTGVFSDVMRLYHPGSVEFEVRACAYDGRSGLELEYEVLDIQWNSLFEGTLKIGLDSDGVGRGALKIPMADKRGAYLLRTRVSGLPDTEQVLDFAVLDDPEKNSAKPNMGLYIDFNQPQAEYFKRAGARYVLSNCDVFTRAYVVLPRKVELKNPDSEAEILEALDSVKYRWYDDAIRGWTECGIEVVPVFMERYMPKWAKDSPAAFGRFVGNMVKHYSKLGIKHWNTGDEVRDNYLPYHLAAAKAIREQDPDAEVMISTCPGIIEKWFEEDGVRTCAIGGSYWTSTKWQYFAKRASSLKLDRPFWNVGVGWGSCPAYVRDPHNIRMNMGRGRFDVVANLLYCHAIASPELLVTYCNRFSNGRSFGTGDMYTGTFVPHGVYFAATAAFIRGAKPGGEIELKNASDLDAFYFERNGKTMVVISQSQAFWGVHRGESAFKLSLRIDPRKVGFYDVNLAEVIPPAAKGECIDWDLPVLGMLILEDRGMGRDALIEAVGKMRAVRTHGARFMLLAGEHGDVDLGLWLKNGLGRDLAGTISIGRRVALDASEERNRALDLGAGESKLMRFALAPGMGACRPIGNLIADYTFSDNTSFAIGEKAHLWGACAHRNPDANKLSGPGAWGQDNLVGYVMGSGRVGGGYGLEQVRKGGACFVSSEVHQMVMRVFATWRPDSLKIGLELDKTMAESARTIDIMFDPGLKDVISGVSPVQKPRIVRIDCSKTAPSVVLQMIGQGCAPGPEQAAEGLEIRSHDNGRFIEILAPANSVLGMTPGAADVSGFNVLVSGVDPVTKERLEFVYSGRPNYRPYDPEGWAQLVFLGSE